MVCLKERNQLDSKIREWNRAILEGQTNPPTLNSEIKYRKRSVLEDSFAINMTPFFKITEPKDNATAIKLFNDESSIEVPIELLPYLFFQFAKDGKRMYDDNAVTLCFNPDKKDTHMNLSMLRI